MLMSIASLTIVEECSKGMAGGCEDVIAKVHTGIVTWTPVVILSTFLRFSSKQ